MSSQQLYNKGSLSLPIEIDVPEDVQLYRDLIKGPRQENDPIEVLAELRTGIDDLPETASTFMLRNVVDYANEWGIYATLMKYTPAWKLPEWYTGNAGDNGRTKYVNPNGAHARIYSDVPTRCECGALVHTARVGNDNSELLDNVPVRSEHSDDCVQIWRWRARAGVWENRREIMLDGIRNCIRGNELVPRTGYAGDNLSDYPQRHDIDYTAERSRARRRMAWTVAHSLHRHSPRKIGQAIGMHRDGVNDLLHREGVADQIDMRELYRIRKGWDT